MMIILFGLGVALSQFYVFPSGVPQPAHFLIAASIIFSIIGKGKFFVTNKSDKVLSALYFLMAYMVAVNFSFALAYFSLDFILSTSYSIFGLMIFLQTRKLMADNNWGIRAVPVFLAAGLLILFGLALAGIGEYKFFPRYNAFFNDPNQMAFWALCVAAILLVSMRSSRLFGVLIFTATIFIIIKSASRSGFVGFSFLLSGYLLSMFSKRRGGSAANLIVFGLVTILSVFILSYAVYSSNSESLAYIFDRVDSTDAVEQADIRGYTRLLEYPEYLLLGAGQGLDTRFVAQGNEIHSTPAGILFYYGIAGFLSLIVILYSVASGLRAYEKLIFFAPIFYSFSTFGFRTPIFWVYLGVFYVLAIKNSANRKRHHI